jgi:hypothetical protein
MKEVRASGGVRLDLRGSSESDGSSLASQDAVSDLVGGYQPRSGGGLSATRFGFCCMGFELSPASSNGRTEAFGASPKNTLGVSREDSADQGVAGRSSMPLQPPVATASLSDEELQTAMVSAELRGDSKVANRIARMLEKREHERAGNVVALKVAKS